MKKKKLNKFIISAAILLSLLGAGAAAFLKYAYVPPVVMYHSIDNNDKSSKLSVSPESFERQMAFLRRNNYNVVSLEEMGRYIKDRKRPPHKTIAITFDDGYYNNYERAYPILKKYKIPATIFIIVDKIGRPGWLGWKELKEMSDSGLVTIGSHTVMHGWLPSVGTEELRSELEESKAIIEKNLAKKADTFCYPLGAYDERVKREVGRAGYACAVVTNPGKHKPGGDVYSIKRIKISNTSDNLLVFWFETSGYYTWVKESRKY